VRIRPIRRAGEGRRASRSALDEGGRYLDNRPGALAEVADKLARVRVNITCAYATTHGTGPALLVLSVSNVAKAEAALGGTLR